MLFSCSWCVCSSPVVAAMTAPATRQAVRPRPFSNAKIEGDQLRVVDDVVVVLVHERVALPAHEEVPVRPPSEREGNGKPKRDAPPEEPVDEEGIHRAGNENHSQIVDRLHDRYRHGVGREDDRERSAERESCSEERDGRERVTEQEGKGDRERDLRGVRPPEQSGDRHAYDFTERAAR